MTYQPIPQEDKWGEQVIRSYDEETVILLKDILKRLEIIALHLQELSGLEITEEDI
jgi:hypothetical protein